VGSIALFIFYFLGAAIAFTVFCASSNLRTITSHFVDWQICFEPFLTSLEKNVSPAARSTASTTNKSTRVEIKLQRHVPGTMKLVKGVSSVMAALGRTKAPVDKSTLSGVDGEDGFVARTTLAK